MQGHAGCGAAARRTRLAHGDSQTPRPSSCHIRVTGCLGCSGRGALYDAIPQPVLGSAQAAPLPSGIEQLPEHSGYNPAGGRRSPPRALYGSRRPEPDATTILSKMQPNVPYVYHIYQEETAPCKTQLEPGSRRPPSGSLYPRSLGSIAGPRAAGAARKAQWQPRAPAYMHV